MMKARSMLLIGLAAASICAVRVYAQPGPGMPGMGHPPMMGGGTGRLIPLLFHSTDLTSDQESQVHQILDADRPAVEQLFTHLKQANTDLANLLLGPQDVQADALSAQLTHLSQLQQQLAQHEADTVLMIRALLTPEQLAKADAAKDNMETWHRGKHRFMDHGD